ncbi:hypothetical protein [Labilibaculum antarcticum]|uniref:Uncharacterized protein n=1 Tax=Labilibaculum antarcticum TaxID=1717717 RepID=A0A1Y1CGR5_9BACT|nr:hypothetical protein [Labilibaculum antarcticum]BAX78481.1 hypothetical protein ALGA_0086 [Labilibaculum antarcticum]
MKNIIKLLSLILVFATFSCEYEEYDVPDIELTSVYTISETNNETMDQINIYRETALLTVWNDKFISSYETNNYSDTSDETTYMVSFTATESVTVTDAEGNESMGTKTYDYVISADKVTGVTSVEILVTQPDASTSTISVSGTLTETEVYN